MNINDEIRQRQAVAHRAESARAAQLDQPGRERGLRLSQDPEVTALARKFVRWAVQSGVKPQLITWRYETQTRLFGRSRQVRVPAEYGWKLGNHYENHNCDSGFCQHTNSVSLVVTTAGEIGWTTANAAVGPMLTAWYVEHHILEYVWEHGRTTPWPD